MAKSNSGGILLAVVVALALGAGAGTAGSSAGGSGSEGSAAAGTGTRGDRMVDRLDGVADQVEPLTSAELTLTWNPKPLYVVKAGTDENVQVIVEPVVIVQLGVVTPVKPAGQVADPDSKLGR